MKVYVITSGCYSEYRIRAVSLDRNEAEKICATFNNEVIWRGYGHMCKIEEYDTEDVKASTKKKVKVRYEMRVNQNGKISHFGNGYFVLSDANRVGKIKFMDDGEFKTGYDITATFPKDTPKEKAQKIMLDRLAEYRAKEEEIF